MTPDQDDFVFFTTALSLGETGGDGIGVGEAKEEGDASFGNGDVFARSFGAVVDLIGRVVYGVIEGFAACWSHG